MEGLTQARGAPLPVWMCALIVLASTALAFWFLGGQHFLANTCEVNYAYFHHAEDETEPVTGLFYLWDTGVFGGVAGCVASMAALAFANRRRARG